MKNKYNNTELHSESVQEILGTPPHWIIRNGIMLVFAIIAILFLGSHFIKCPDVITASITITSPQKGKIILPPQYANEIKPGLKIKIIPDNQSDTKYKIIDMTLDSFVMVLNENQEGRRYLIEFPLPENLEQGMTGTAKITINERTLLDRFLEPMKTILKQER